MRRRSASPVAGIDNLPIPTCPEQANENLQKLAEASRRSFLGRGLVAAAAPAALLAGSSIAKAAAPKAPFPELYPGQNEQLFVEVQVDEQAHVLILENAIKTLGGTPRPMPSFTGLTTSDPATFLKTSIALENTGVHAYFGAAGYIYNPNVLAVAVSIGLVEAYHSGWLNSLGHNPLIPGGTQVATPYTVYEVLVNAGPFITNLNDNGAFPPTFSTTPSPANDIAILNFALMLEQLESYFYNQSVPLIFPGAY